MSEAPATPNTQPDITPEHQMELAVSEVPTTPNTQPAIIPEHQMELAVSEALITPKTRPAKRSRFKGLMKILWFCFLIGGWVLAYASLYLVHAPGHIPFIGRLAPWLGTFHLMTKEHLDFRQTFSDTAHWTLKDVWEHPDLVKRLDITDNSSLYAHVGTPAQIANAKRGILPPPPKPATRRARPLPPSLPLGDPPLVEDNPQSPQPPQQPQLPLPRRPREDPPGPSIFDFGRDNLRKRR